MKWMLAGLLALAINLPFSAVPNAMAKEFLFGVNEGSSSAQEAFQRRSRYADLTKRMGAITGGEVTAETSNTVPILVRNLESKRYDLALVRPSNIAARAMRDQGYKLVAMGKGEIKVHFIVRKDSPIKTLEDLKGRVILMPGKEAAPTKVAMAVLRDAGLAGGQVHIEMVKLQEAVVYAVENGLADVGVIALGNLVKDWNARGGRTLYVKDKLPFWSIIAAPSVSDKTVAGLRTMLIGLEGSADGQKILEAIGVKGFVPGKQDDFLQMLSWLEKK